MRKTLTSQDAFLIALGESIHERRVHLGMSQQELADLAGVHRTYVSDIERGARNLTVTTVSRIAYGLDITPSRLFRMADDRVDALAAEEG
ncbi:MAG TPA: helix-turn-helix transcriptional regulator [Trichormus sp.]|jgi:transcriptional regulator with XRE-family HTH domain